MFFSFRMSHLFNVPYILPEGHAAAKTGGASVVVCANGCGTAHNPAFGSIFVIKTNVAAGAECPMATPSSSTTATRSSSSPQGSVNPLAISRLEMKTILAALRLPTRGEYDIEKFTAPVVDTEAQPAAAVAPTAADLFRAVSLNYSKRALVLLTAATAGFLPTEAAELFPASPQKKRRTSAGEPADAGPPADARALKRDRANAASIVVDLGGAATSYASSSGQALSHAQPMARVIEAAQAHLLLAVGAQAWSTQLPALTARYEASNVVLHRPAPSGVGYRSMKFLWAYLEASARERRQDMSAQASTLIMYRIEDFTCRTSALDIANIDDSFFAMLGLATMVRHDAVGTRLLPAIWRAVHTAIRDAESTSLTEMRVAVIAARAAAERDGPKAPGGGGDTHRSGGGPTQRKGGGEQQHKKPLVKNGKCTGCGKPPHKRSCRAAERTHDRYEKMSERKRLQAEGDPSKA